MKELNQLIAGTQPTTVPGTRGIEADSDTTPATELSIACPNYSPMRRPACEHPDERFVHLASGTSFKELTTEANPNSPRQNAQQELA
ncbi:hypothetical protein R1flu_006982 [Riccia fluitans]|uniref:Uncharacterized protein n=1 Tax=Riccia fluitans TaxID=41844 RepID=A0ABD1YXR8_9MARC